MSELIRFESAGGEVLVEVADDAFGVDRASRDDQGVVKAAGRLEDALSAIRPATRAVREVLAELGPRETQVEFGVKLNGEAGAVIAKTGVEGHFQVTLRWTGQPDSPSE